MQYMVLAHDFTDEHALDRRMKARPAHIALGDQLKAEGKLHFGAAILDEADRMIGSMYVAEFETRAELDQWLAQEPYVVQKVWDKITISPCRVGPSFASR